MELKIIPGQTLKIFPFLLFYITKSYLEASISIILQYIMPSVYTVIVDFGCLSIFVALKNEARHINILQRKLIRIERENVYFIYSKIKQFLEFISGYSIGTSRIVN